MQLLYSPTSPYARKCRVVARERGLIPGIEEVDCNPHEDPAELQAKNPLGRVPTLVLDDGRAVFDSPVICDLLEGLGSAPPLVPGVGQGKFQVLVAAAMRPNGPPAWPPKIFSSAAPCSALARSPT